MATFDLNSEMKKEYVRACQAKNPVESYQKNVDGLTATLSQMQGTLDDMKDARDESLNVLMADFSAGPGTHIYIVFDGDGNPVSLTW